MYSETCARLMKFMMPNTRVSPAAIRNSMTPNCRPFSVCSKRRGKFTEAVRSSCKKKGASAPLSVRRLRESPLHLAVLVVRVLVLLEDGFLDVHLDVAVRQ